MSAFKKIMLQTPIIMAVMITAVRLGLRHMFRQANWKYIKYLNLDGVLAIGDTF
jgi:hypothetical protein